MRHGMHIFTVETNPLQTFTLIVTPLGLGLSFTLCKHHFSHAYLHNKCHLGLLDFVTIARMSL